MIGHDPNMESIGRSIVTPKVAELAAKLVGEETLVDLPPEAVEPTRRFARVLPEQLGLITETIEETK